MTAQQMLEQLRVVLAAHLGRYVLRSVDVGEALAIGLGRPPGYQATGLECTLRRSPDFESRDEFGRSDRGLDRVWVVRLRQWDENASLDEALAAVLDAYPMTEVPPIVGPTEDLIESCTIRLVEN